MRNHRTITRTALPIAALLALPLGAEVASAAAPAASTVTITAEGTDLSGTVSSPKASCEGDRKVVVFKQRGTRGGGNDVRLASDITEVQGGIGVWSTGNTGESGKFYAKVTKTTRCKADFSGTVVIPEK